MKIYKEVLDRLEMGSCFISGAADSLCKPFEIKGDEWKVIADNGTEGKVTLNVCYRGRYLKFSSSMSRLDGVYYGLKVDGSGAAGPAAEFMERLRKMEETCFEWDKRKEDRYEVGRRWKELKFAGPEQRLLAAGCAQECYVNNISMSGMNVYTWENPRFKRGMGVVMEMRFAAPDERITVRGTALSVVRRQNAASGRRGFMQISMSLVQPPQRFKERVFEISSEAGE